jgi:hypothetical protein
LINAEYNDRTQTGSSAPLVFCLQVGVIVVLERHLIGCGEFGSPLCRLCGIDLHLRRQESRRLDERARGVTRQLARDVEEGLFEVVVAFGGDIVVLQILLAVELNFLQKQTDTHDRKAHRNGK